MTARISSINLSWKDNYVHFNDSDIMTDYCHGYSLGVNSSIEWIKKHGDRKIVVSVTNDDPKIPALKRVQQIAKLCDYSIEDTSHEQIYHGYMDKEIKGFVLEWLLTANPERVKLLDAEDHEEERKRLEAEAHAKTPEARKARLCSEIYQARNVTAVFDERGFHTVTEEERAKQIGELEAELKKLSE